MPQSDLVVREVAEPLEYKFAFYVWLVDVCSTSCPDKYNGNRSAVAISWAPKNPKTSIESVCSPSFSALRALEDLVPNFLDQESLRRASALRTKKKWRQERALAVDSVGVEEATVVLSICV